MIAGFSRISSIKPLENEDKEGTWTLIATQGKNKEFTYVGI